VRLEFECADRMGHAFDRVGLAVREVVGRVDVPGVAGARVRCVDDPVQDRIAEVDVRRGHIDRCPQHAGAVGKLARAHSREQVNVFLDRPVAIRRVAPGLRQRPAVLADLVGRQVVHVGIAVSDQVDGPLVELLEVVGRVVEVLGPVEAQPADVALDGVDVLLLLLDRVRVVEPEVAVAAEIAGDAEVQGDRLGMADVQVAVRLGWETRDDRRMAPGAHIRGHNLADEVGAFGRWFGAALRGRCRAHPRRVAGTPRGSAIDDPGPPRASVDAPAGSALRHVFISLQTCLLAKARRAAARRLRQATRSQSRRRRRAAR
jgi:hypothetical protein